MGVAGGPDMIENGLILSLDASDRNSYVSGSTTWLNLGRNQFNGTLTNGPTFATGSGGFIVLDGTNDYIQLSGSGINVGVTFTVQTWVRIGRFGGYANGWNRGSVITNSYPYSSDQGFWICCTSQGSPSENYNYIPGRERFFISIGNDQYGATSATGSLTPYTQSWFNIAARVDGINPIKLYINGLPVSSYDSNHQTNGPSSLNYNSGPCSLGIRNDNSEYLSGSIAALGMYNRALTDSEILQNYNATKARFGL